MIPSIYFMMTGISLLKANNGKTKAMCEICSKLTITTPERRSGVFIVDFKQISHIAILFQFLTLSK